MVTPHRTSVHRLRRGLPGYLIRFAPHAVVPECQYRASQLASPWVFLPISTHFTTTPAIPPTSPGLEFEQSAMSLRQLSRRLSHRTCTTTCGRFTPSKSGQRLPPLSYRGCWHRVSRGLFWGYRPFLPPKKQFTTRKPSSCTRRCSIRLAPIVENSLLLPPVGVWVVSQSQSGWLSSQTSYPSKAWWAFTPPTTVMGRRPLFQRVATFLTRKGERMRD